MSVTLDETLMAVGDFNVTVDHTPAIYAEVWDSTDKRPKKVHVLIYDEDDTLIYMGVLLRVTGDKNGLEIGGSGMLWHLGQGEVGPLIMDREYVSGNNKLSNGDFALGDILWRLPSEESNWTVNVGSAFNWLGRAGDDVLESDEKFETDPGKQYRATISGLTGSGRMRVRAIFDGSFNPPNLWTNGDLAAGSTGWTGGTNVVIMADHINAFPGSLYVMRCLPIPKPQLIVDSGFETGTGWTDITVPAPMSDDIDLVNDPSLAHTGQWVMRVGPVTQHQVFINADFGWGGQYWYASSSDAEPHNVFAPELGMGVNGSDGIITAGWSTAGRPGPELIKYLRADSINGGGVDTYEWRPGETYRAEAYLHGHPGSDGSAYISIMIPGDTPANDIWMKSDELFAPPHDDNRWARVTIDGIYVPEDGLVVNALAEFHNHSLGWWSLDHFTLTRTQGNRAKIQSDTTYAVDPDTTYEIAAHMRAAEPQQTGTVKVGVMLEGAPDNQSEGTERSSTDLLWERVATTVYSGAPGEGFTHLRPFVSALDIIGSPTYVDSITLTKMDNNRDSMTGPTVNVIPERTYRATCKFRAGLELERGDARMAFRCIRGGYPDVLMESSPVGATENEWIESTYDVTPPSGYDEVECKVVFTDVEGDIIYASHFTFTDTDTNTVVFDGFTDSPVAGSASVDATAPDGSEYVRVAAVAEEGSNNWVLLAMSLARIGVTPATVPSIMTDLFKDPETGEWLSLLSGTIAASGPIPYDWRILNMTNRDALEHLCNVVSDPPLEFHVGVDRTLSVAEATTIFDDHTDIVLLGADMDVMDLSNSTSNVEERSTVIRVIGADRQTVSGKPLKIQAESVVPGTPEKDWNNKTIRRVKPHHDGTVDHFGYAQALADDLAAKEAIPALNLTASISGVNTRPAFVVGDWIYAYEPEAGLIDTANPMTIEGETVFPRKVRVLGRTRELGPTHRIVLRRTDGTTYELPRLKVGWSEKDSTTLTIGDREVDWISDPAGGADAMRYMKDRQHRP